MKTNEQLQAMLRQCQPFLRKALASLPGLSSDYKEAERLNAEIDAECSGIVTAALRRSAIIEGLKRYHGLPPHDGFDPCRGDGYFAIGLCKKFGAQTLKELETEVGFAELQAEWNKARAAFAGKA